MRPLLSTIADRFKTALASFVSREKRNMFQGGRGNNTDLLNKIESFENQQPYLAEKRRNVPYT